AVATFVLFRFAGLGFNLVTLSGLALSIGLAVDNAIVLFENVAHRARGIGSAGRRNLRTIAAAREVLFPLLAGTATTAVVMTPFLYLEGELRDVYAPFVLSVVLSLVASLGVALTVVPAATAWALAGGGARSAGKRRLERGFDRLLRAVLRRPIVPILASAVLLGASLWVFAEKVPKGSIFAPQADTKLRVSLGFPPGTDLAHADNLLRRFEDRVLGHEFYRNDWISSVDVLVRADLATLTVDFPVAVARTLAPISLQEELTQVAATIAGADVSVSGSGPGFQRARSFVSPSYLLRVTGPEYERVRDLSFAIAERLRREPRVRDVDPNGSGLFVEDARELVIRPDREALARVGLTATDLVRTLRPAVADELDSRRLSGPDGELRARVRFTGGETLDVADLRALRVPIPRGPSVAVADVAAIEERALPGEIRRRDQRYERSISFDYRGPRRVGDRFTRSIVENTELPTGYLLEDGLGLFLTRTERRDLNLSIALAVGLVALVSAALFESVSLALIATLCIPLAFVGIPFVFWLSGETFDRTAYVGLILLAGIAVNNALLLVHRAGHLRRRGASRRDAARRATVERVRPVLLTTATSVAGLVPLVWQGGGTGAGTWRAFALAGIAGLSAAALFTLLVIPCLFVPLARFRGGRPRGRPGAIANVPPTLPRLNLPSTKGVAR
ncbi:MAG: efflux RND transporter permease subunit, partial [Gemmatimonadetes bacterium]|nr:efflux RND transporter permease subunit [Gemmatimonadota bacterium]